MIGRWSVLVALLAFAAVLAPGAFAENSRDWMPSDDWITIDKDYSSQRYVDLDQINPANVGKLKEVCEIRLNELTPFSTGILKVGRTLYVNTARMTVAFDAGDLRRALAIYGPVGGAHDRQQQVLRFAHPNGKIFAARPMANSIALDARTGEKRWSVSARDTDQLETLVSAPIAWRGKVFIGIAIGDLPIAGRLMAFDADSGRRLWRSFNTTLDPMVLQGGGFWNSYSLNLTDWGNFRAGRQPASGLQPRIDARFVLHPIYRILYHRGERRDRPI